jgi:hypothetical protein
MKKHFFKHCVLVVMLLLSFSARSQNFEGSITYKVEVANPMPDKISDSDWQKIKKEKFGEKGYLVQKYYYKENNYLSEIEAGNQKGYQVYNPKDGLLYAWQLNSDSAVTVDSKKTLDTFVGFKESEKTETILGIPCKSVIVETSFGKTILWYNSNYFKMDAKFYAGHTYGHWEQILKRIGCLPLKIESAGLMNHMVQTAIEYKQTSVSPEQFKIPAFKVVIANPIN